MKQFNFWGVKAKNLAPDATELPPISPGAHSSAVYDDSGVGKRIVRNQSVPIAPDTSLFDGYRNRGQQRAIVHLRLSRKTQSLMEFCVDRRL
jgi:hypothetical protein